MISDGPSPPAVPRPATTLAGRVLLLAAAGLVATSGLLPAAALQALRYDRDAVAAGEWWRLATAHVVHLGIAHALLNAAALVLIAWIATPLRRPLPWLVLVLASAAAIDAGLGWLYPEVVWYLGASGVLHGVFAGAALVMAVRGEAVRGAVMLAALAAKLAWESAGGGSLFLGGIEEFPVLEQAHVLGAGGGLIGALALLARHGRL